MTLPAIGILRVSGDDQDEQAQRADVLTAAEREGFTVTRWIELHAVSGYKGDKRHLAALDNAKLAVINGEAKAVVIAHSSRAGRLAPRTMLRWAWDIDDAGGRVISHDEAMFGGSDIGSEIMSFVSATENRKKSDDISAHVQRANRKLDSEGAWRGAAMAGYRITGPKRAKRLAEAEQPYVIDGDKRQRRVPSADQVRDAFKRAATESTTTLGTFLHMTPDAVNKMLRDTFYSTGIHKVRRQDGTTYVYRVEPLVTVAVQNAAVAGLERRRTGDNLTSRSMAREDYSGAVRCSLGHVMYRYFASGIRRYRCDTCRTSVKADAADTLINSAISALTDQYVYETVHHGGDDGRTDAIARKKLELDSPPSGMDRQKRREWEDKLWDEIESLENTPGTEPWTETIPSDETIAALWDAADHAGKVRLLKTRASVRVRAAAGRSGEVELAQPIVTTVDASTLTMTMLS